MRSSYGKIARGALIGVVLGCIGGIGIANTIYVNKHLKTDTSSKQVMAYYDSSGRIEENDNPPKCSNLEDVILRFHVKANSNSEADIDLKHKVRDTVLMKIGGQLKGNKSMDEVVEYLSGNLEFISEIAAEVVDENGFDYPINVYISNDYFPIRKYGELVLPAGMYKALRIDIGQAKGENFWCILYPFNCYTYEAAAVVDSDMKKTLKRKITDEEYEKLFVKRDVKKENVKIRFKLLELIKDKI